MTRLTGTRWPAHGTAGALLLLMACSGADSGITDADPPDGARTQRCTQSFGDPADSPYQLPFAVGRAYRLIQGYCPQHPAWGHHDWLAYDFDMAIGDTVLASRAGRVFAVRDSFPDATRVCGEENWVFIEHADGTAMMYVHFTRGGALVALGEDVDAGQPIGLSGDSGCSSGPHLHVALFRDRSSFGAANGSPLNYRNAIGPLDARNGLVQGQVYQAIAPPHRIPKLLRSPMVRLLP